MYEFDDDGEYEPEFEIYTSVSREGVKAVIIAGPYGEEGPLKVEQICFMGLTDIPAVVDAMRDFWAEYVGDWSHKCENPTLQEDQCAYQELQKLIDAYELWYTKYADKAACEERRGKLQVDFKLWGKDFKLEGTVKDWPTFRAFAREAEAQYRQRKAEYLEQITRDYYRSIGVNY